MNEEMEKKEIDIKEEISIQEAILPSSTVEDTCTVYLQEEDSQMKFSEFKGNLLYLGKGNKAEGGNRTRSE